MLNDQFVEGAIIVPTNPNNPLNSVIDDDPMVPMVLRTNKAIGFTENEIFDQAHLTYDSSYQASQEHSPTFQAHMRAMLLLLRGRFPAQTKITEIGCGKGAFMSMLEQDGYQRVVGYDPTYDGEKENIRRQYLTGSDRLDAVLYVMRHTLEHIPRPHEFLRMIYDLSVNRECTIYVEAPCFDWAKRNDAFFGITYEHPSYFSLHALNAMFGNKVISSGHVFNG